MDLDLISIINAQYLGDSKFILTFNDGIIKEVDINAFLKSDPLYFSTPVFQPLKDELFVREFKLENATLTWQNQIDIAPEILYQLTM